MSLHKPCEPRASNAIPRTLSAQLPKPGAKIQAIGVGLPRTATNSFCAATAFLLNGPAYHVGVQTALSSDETHVRTWIDILQNRNSPSEQDKQAALKQIAKILDGYVVAADTPISQLIPELVELYPNAKFVCTQRDPESWSTSMEFIASQVRPTIQKYIFYWMRSLRWLPSMWDFFSPLYDERYGVQARTKAKALKVWDKHHVWVKEVVPSDRLHYVDMKDGWEPLCKALDVPVPEGVPFPRLNDAADYLALFRRWAVIGLLRWIVVIVAIFFLSKTVIGFRLP